MQGHPSPSSPWKEWFQHHSITSRCVAPGVSGDLWLPCPGNSLSGRGGEDGCWGLILSQQAEQQPGAVTGILLMPQVSGCRKHSHRGVRLPLHAPSAEMLFEANQQL